MTTKFTNAQLDAWRAYEKVRQVRLWNSWYMFSPQALAASGLDADTYRFVMYNYGQLRDAVNAKEPQA